jgi:hypothetical protein
LNKTRHTYQPSKQSFRTLVSLLRRSRVHLWLIKMKSKLLMNPPPPPLPKNPDPVWEGLRTYLLAILYLLPSIFVISFASAFLLPKLNQIWDEAGLRSSKAAWMMGWVEGTIPYFVFCAAGFILFAFVCEVAWSTWRRLRRSVVTVFMLLVHTAVLAWITAIAVNSLLAAPMLAQKKVRELKAAAEQAPSDHP